MMPISEINVGDQYSNPAIPGMSCVFYVEEVNRTEKMVKIQAFSSMGMPIQAPFWKKNTDRMFSESWRIFNGVRWNAG